MAQQLMDNKLKSDWSHFRAALKEKWRELTDQDIQQINGNYDILVEKLKLRYGYSQDQAENYIDSWIAETPSSFTDRSTSRSSSKEEFRSAERRDAESTFWKWLLGLALAALVLGSYYYWDQTKTDSQTITPSSTTRTATPSDTQIIDTLRSSFTSDPALSRLLSGIRFEISHGVVTLTGSVSTPEEKEMILRTVRSTSGVTQVVDNIIVR